MSRNELYRTRKPWLRLDILGCLVLHGELTKGDAEDILSKRHGDILDSFNKLEEKNFIEKGRRAFGRGRKQFYYKITEKGLVILFTFEPNPTKFWKSMFGYFHHFNDKYKMNTEKVNELFSQFGKAYFKYSHYNLPVQYDTFKSMRDRWFKLLEQKIRTDNRKISIQQKIVEALAMRPKMTLRELATEIGEAELDVSEVLSMYTNNSFNPANLEDSSLIFRNMMDCNEKDKFDDEYLTSFLLHNLVRINRINHQDNYELTIFGIILVLNLIRYHDMNRLNGGLFYGNILSFSKYFDMVATNYQNSLPLIFGKWKLLKKVLKPFAAYNFDITLDRQKYSDHSKRDSVRRGGNREILDGIEDIAKYRYQQLYDLAKAGQAVSFRYLTPIMHDNPNKFSKGYHGDYIIRNKIKIDSPDLKKLAPVYNLLMGLLLMLKPFEYLTSRAQSSELQQIVTKTELLNMLEEAFVDEISALYYFNLFDVQEFRTVFNVNRVRYSALGSSIPKECLYRILRNDDEGSLKDWFNRWITDIVDLQKENCTILKLLV